MEPPRLPGSYSTPRAPLNIKNVNEAIPRGYRTYEKTDVFIKGRIAERRPVG
jgi:hypothetical protein